MRLGFYTYSYIDRLGMEPEAVFRAVAEAGYGSVDISATWRADLDPALYPQARREEIRRLADQFHLRIEAVVTHPGLVNALREGQPINLPGAVDLAMAVGSPLVTVHPGSCSLAGCSDAEGWDLAVDYLRGACAYAAERGVSICLDAVFPGFLTDTPEKVIQLIEDVGSAHLRHNFDPCYLVVAGFDLEEAGRLLAPYAAHAHIKDHAGRWPKFEHRIPGDGEMNHEVWARVLAAAGFDGAVAVECFTDHPLPQAAGNGHAAVSQALRRAGVTR